MFSHDLWSDKKQIGFNVKGDSKMKRNKPKRCSTRKNLPAQKRCSTRKDLPVQIPKSEIVTELSKEFGPRYSKSEIQAMVDRITLSVVERLKASQSAKLVGFGEIIKTEEDKYEFVPSKHLTSFLKE